MITPEVENFEFSTSLSAGSSAACARTGAAGKAATASEAVAAIRVKRRDEWRDERRTRRWVRNCIMRHLPVRLEERKNPIRGESGRVFRQNVRSRRRQLDG